MQINIKQLKTRQMIEVRESRTPLARHIIEGFLSNVAEVCEETKIIAYTEIEFLDKIFDLLKDQISVVLDTYSRKYLSDESFKAFMEFSKHFGLMIHKIKIYKELNYCVWR